MNKTSGPFAFGERCRAGGPAWRAGRWQRHLLPAIRRMRKARCVRHGRSAGIHRRDGEARRKLKELWGNCRKLA